MFFLVHEHGDQGLASIIIERAAGESVRQVLYQVLVAEGTFRGVLCILSLIGSRRWTSFHRNEE
jgi:hypothetical protein